MGIPRCWRRFTKSPLELLAQRYGRPDSAQNYGRVQNPQLLLQVKIQKKRAYFRTSDLRKMPRVHLTASDPTTGLSHTYEGVRLEDLLPARVLDSQSAVMEVTFDSHHTTTIPSVALDVGHRRWENAHRVCSVLFSRENPQRDCLYLDSRKTAKAIAPRIASAANFGKFILRRKIGTRKSAIRKAVSIPYPSNRHSSWVMPLFPPSLRPPAS